MCNIVIFRTLEKITISPCSLAKQTTWFGSYPCEPYLIFVFWEQKYEVISPVNQGSGREGEEE